MNRSCGQGTCRQCAKDEAVSSKITRCPLCRDPELGGSGTKRVNKILKYAKRQEAWALDLMGDIFLGVGPRDGLPLDKAKALHWYKLGAEQNYPRSIYKSTAITDDPDLELVRKSADMGYVVAQAHLAKHHFSARSSRKQSDASDNTTEALRYASLVAINPWNFNEHPFVATILATLSSDPFLKKRYLDDALKDTAMLSHCGLYSQALLMIDLEFFEGHSYLSPGYNPVPKALHMARKAAIPQITATYEARFQCKCANCNKQAPQGGKFNRCGKCKATWYCSRECQVDSWKAGHKFDCKQK